MERNLIPIQNYQDFINAWELVKQKVPLTLEFNPVRCKHCNSKRISKYGRYKDVQLWWCQECKRKFTGNNASPGMKISIERIESALSMYFKGMPLSSIRKQLKEEYDYYPSDSTVYRWVHQSTENVLEVTKDHHPIISNTWIVYESRTLTGLNTYWVSDIIDAGTHFLLASRLSSNRCTEDIKILVESAMQKAHNIPEILITRNASRYSKAVEQIMGLEAERLKIRHPDSNQDMKFSVYWHNIRKGRIRILHSLKSLKILRLTLQGWMINYNYYSPQSSLQGKTPASAAGLDTDWKSIIRYK